MAKNTYQTGARTQILRHFAQNPDRQFTVDALCEAISTPADGKPIAKSTLYRQLCTLCREGALQRFDGTDPKTGATVRYYQAAGEDGSCAQHFHLKCLCCGELQHLDCDRTEAMLSHLLQAHLFHVDCGRSILYGVCRSCAASRDEDDAPLHPSSHQCPCGCGKTKHRVKDYGMMHTKQG